MTLKTYSGFLRLADLDEAEGVLFISSQEDPLAEVLLQEISKRTVTARYWIADKEISKEEASQCFIEKLMGVANIEFYLRYSDCTGFLWCDEEIKIGGHNLLSELRSYVGMYLILEVEIHNP